MKKTLLALISVLIFSLAVLSQETVPPQGISDNRTDIYLFKDATIYTDYKTSMEHADLLIKGNRIVQVGTGIEAPDNAIVRVLSGKTIYPSFIDLDSEYGLPAKKPAGSGVTMASYRARSQQFEASNKGPFNWNDAIRPWYNSCDNISANKQQAKEYLDIGFGTVLSHNHDGIARGTSVLLSLAEDRSNKLVIFDKAASHYSFDKGTSTQSYPGSLMGSIALLRQTYLDASWYESKKDRSFNDQSMEAWNDNKKLPSIFEVSDKLNFLRADKIGKEFSLQYIIKGAGDEYQMLKEIKQTGAPVILPLNFPAATDVSDPYVAMMVPLEVLKHWELAPSNPGRLAKEGVPLALTSSGLKARKEFHPNLRKAIKQGLSEEQALKALTHTPASLIGAGDKLGSLKKGYLANFIITSGNVFTEDAAIYENWVQGKKNVVTDINARDLSGKYKLNLDGETSFTLEISGKPGKHSCSITAKDSLKSDGKLTVADNTVSLNFKDPTNKKDTYRLSGWLGDKRMSGTAVWPDGTAHDWSAVYADTLAEKEKKQATKQETDDTKGEIIYPFVAYGTTVQPGPSHILFTGATVWTNEEEGVLENADVLVQNGKIIKVGRNLEASGAEVIDASGKHITAGIIDEHSHIAGSGGINEATHAITSEVRMADILDHEDINIYRQLSGGVTSAQILHGSANPIGGQSAVIKHRWGASPEELKLEGAAQFLKHALGENVKQSRTPSFLTSRYPQTRMGVEQIIKDAYVRGREYVAAWDKYNSLPAKEKAQTVAPRRDLTLEAIGDMLQKKSYMTCHTYIQSEANMIMKLAEEFGFTAHTLIHNTEGYKVADKMREHGAAGSIFSDWWAFKFEVYHAIPYNAALHLDQEVLTCIHSDNAELSRRLNQEAAKAVKYGGVSEEEALKLVTLNPAKILHIDDWCGSIKVGKDADLVLWSGHPLSIYTHAEKTLVDGIVYFDMEKDRELQEWIRTERARLIKKMMEEKPAATTARTMRANRQYEWDDEAVFDYFHDNSNETELIDIQQ